MTIALCVHFICYVYLFTWLTSLEILILFRNISLQKSKNLQFVGIFLKSLWESP